ncbi:YrhB domain-containing protein [Streptomyces orinoci]|uniref:YrhB domain-containing protein n=1 Tax=Streptomyces orinoci TaxID=67339 RepID=UPI003BABEC07
MKEHALGWLVIRQSVEYIRSRDPEKMLVGRGPYPVDRQDGSIHHIPVTTYVAGGWEEFYRWSPKVPWLRYASCASRLRCWDHRGRRHTSWLCETGPNLRKSWWLSPGSRRAVRPCPSRRRPVRLNCSTTGTVSRGQRPDHPLPRAARMQLPSNGYALDVLGKGR